MNDRIILFTAHRNTKSDTIKRKLCGIKQRHHLFKTIVKTNNNNKLHEFEV